MKLITHHKLGDTPAANRILPSVIPSVYGGYGERTEWLHPQLRLLKGESRNLPEGLEHDRTLEVGRDQLSTSLDLIDITGDWMWGKKIVDLAVSQNTISLDHMQQGLFAWWTASKVAAVYEHSDMHAEAFRWYLWALESVEGRIQGATDLASRQGARSTMHTSGLYEGLARLALIFARPDAPPTLPSHSGLTSTDWTMQSLRYLEQGRARALFDFLQAQQEMSKLSKDLLQKWSKKEYLVRKMTESHRRVADTHESVGHSPGCIAALEQEAAEARHLLESHAPDVAAIFANIRFDLPAEAIVQQLGSTDAVIYIHLSRFGFILFCITQDGIQMVHRGESRDIDVQRHVLSYTKCLRDHTRSPTTCEHLAQISTEIASLLLVPCAQIIRKKSHLIFVRPAAMDGFPFSALQWNGHPLHFTHAVSETPSLAVLRNLIQTATKRSVPKNKISVIANPHLHNNRGKLATMVGVGALSLAACYATQACNSLYLSDEAFTTKFQESQIVHIGTHGEVSSESPWQSWISLKENFKVMDIAKLHSQASLVVFEACVSGLGRVTTGNDVTGFSHAILQSGASAYIGSLWEVDSLSSLALMYLFYKQLRTQQDHCSVAECWRRAQVSLYHSNTSSFRELLQEIRASFSQDEAIAFEHPHADDDLSDAIDDLEDEDFRHPFYWAAFTIVGYGGQIVARIGDASPVF
ncbi:hypothetical protein BDW02DRAFT_509344 [Decorospora gaudefroyi]|uniref:CHAT domain-containing protein n=1 Tax=Decorospora gaudefroyi TaxID=184978 RepID=A0A6A5JZF8_9PLEO|nr:hypothetical protein BDW02DRAFT_509344 [Decorospora gaudefroyi]